MSARQIIFLVLAVFIVAGTFMVTKNFLNNRQTVVVQKEPEKPKGTFILVAKTDIPTGAFIQKQQLHWQSWPADALSENYLVQDKHTMDDLLGAVARRGLTAGEPINRKRIVQPGDRGFLAAVLRPGYRAMAIRVNATSGISGLIFPGDRVDLILTMTVVPEGEKKSDDADKMKASETVLTNVRILAIDQAVDDTNGKPRVGKNATLEITPKQAEMLAVITELGSLSLALRSLAKDEEELERLVESDDPLEEPDPARGGTFTFENEVSYILGTKEKTVEVIRGGRSRAERVDETGTGTQNAAPQPQPATETN